MTISTTEPAAETWMTVAEAATITGLSASTLTRYARRGLVRARKVGLKRWTIAGAAVEAMLQGNLTAMAK